MDRLDILGADRDLDTWDRDGLDWKDRLDILGADRDLDTWDRGEAPGRETRPAAVPPVVILWEKEGEERIKTRPSPRPIQIGFTLDGIFRLMTQLL